MDNHLSSYDCTRSDLGICFSRLPSGNGYKDSRIVFDAENTIRHVGTVSGSVIKFYMANFGREIVKLIKNLTGLVQITLGHFGEAQLEYQGNGKLVQPDAHLAQQASSQCERAVYMQQHHSSLLFTFTSDSMKPKRSAAFKETAPLTIANGEQLAKEDGKKFRKTILMGNCNDAIGKL
ncbi:hypothetical protein T01_6816 [Trichinella spiralis]|uniref:Uncharacterized protein n=1 Tax=Trichinella spiralis TaxID=6334 RepID=A0A0V1AWF4_TRISP|nr:hypothetical protein T01_6816 [Trichinella spiralis]